MDDDEEMFGIMYGVPMAGSELSAWIGGRCVIMVIWDLECGWFVCSGFVSPSIREGGKEEKHTKGLLLPRLDTGRALIIRQVQNHLEYKHLEPHSLSHACQEDVYRCGDDNASVKRNELEEEEWDVASPRWEAHH